MKKLLFILLLSPLLTFAQADSTKTDTAKTDTAKAEAKIKPHEEFCMLWFTPNLLFGKRDVYVKVDLGKPDNALSEKQLMEKKTLRNIGNLVEALNYMSAQGWEFVNSYAYTYDSTSTVQSMHYIFKRKL